MATLYNKLFETFDTLSKSNVTNGSIDGVISPYSVPAKDSVGIAVDTLNDSDRIDSKISIVHKKCQYNIMMVSASDMEGFRTLCERLTDAFKLNKIFDNDPLIQTKLAEILAYSYISKNSTYLIYPDIFQAKTKALSVFNVAKKLGLNFLNSKVEDLLKKVLLTVFYKISFDQDDKQKTEQAPTKPTTQQQPLQQPLQTPGIK